MISIEDRELFERLVQAKGRENQLNQAIEELCELAVAIRHYIRGRRGSRHAMLKEVADVSIMLDQLLCILGEPDKWHDQDTESLLRSFAAVRAGELARLRERLDSGELA
ncbi:hypothetical protein [Nitratidesulfovibrio liaohensis]|uniref:MazG nucleotide pyrophosphohydrolase domain-containing protein n=1 Tax=Nitratidesulfovibrio liaohensis TaxID=2604158 RepID=A0ABY9QY08_9BACT|nr:hypothetical protein [Nitratidesulfovibrio liaohensis]WMW64415.1 hypothetical protein KPS_002428 [Nitratidesulfovibrio liaohensis]